MCVCVCVCMCVSLACFICSQIRTDVWSVLTIWIMKHCLKNVRKFLSPDCENFKLYSVKIILNGTIAAVKRT